MRTNLNLFQEIGKLTNLTRLWLYSNNLKKLPKSIGNFVNLKEARLDISGNPLKSLPDSIRKVEHALVASSKDEYKLLLEDVGLVSIEGANTYDSTVIVAKPKS